VTDVIRDVLTDVKAALAAVKKRWDDRNAPLTKEEESWIWKLESMSMNLTGSNLIPWLRALVERCEAAEKCGICGEPANTYRCVVCYGHLQENRAEMAEEIGRLKTRLAEVEKALQEALRWMQWISDGGPPGSEKFSDAILDLRTILLNPKGAGDASE